MSTRIEKARPGLSEKQRIRFQGRIAFVASGGKFCDGWILAVIGVVLPLSSATLGMTPMQEGLIGSAALIGLFIGGLVFGRVADKIGRKRVFLGTLLVFLIGSMLQIFVLAATQLFILRLLMGLAIGADYAIAGSLIAEFASKDRRGPYLAGLITWWYAGFAFAATAALVALAIFGQSEMIWRLMLASSAVPALVMLIARLGIPESPRWLMSRGRREEAEQLAEKYLTKDVRQDLCQEAPASSTSFTRLFSKENIRKTAFTSIFWMAQVTPFFAIYTFLPNVLDGLNLNLDGYWAEVVLYAFLFIGSAVGTLNVNRIGRRRLLIVPFIITAITMLILGVWTSAPAAVVITCFLAFALLNSASGVLQMLYPSEIFSTDIRATGVGFAAAMSRVGAAVGTFLLPIVLNSWGVGSVMLISAGILLVGLWVSWLWAPETTNQELTIATQAVPTVESRGAEAASDSGASKVSTRTRA